MLLYYFSHEQSVVDHTSVMVYVLCFSSSSRTINASNPFIMPFNINASVANFLPSFFSREKSAIYVVVFFSA